MTESNKFSNVRAAFETWRNERAKKQRIPDQLWQKAISLLQDYPISHVAKELGLHSGELRKRQTALNKQTISNNQIHEQTPFIELNQFLPSANTSVDIGYSNLEIQIERKDGARLTLSLNSSQTDIVQNLVTAFIRV